MQDGDDDDNDDVSRVQLAHLVVSQFAARQRASGVRLLYVAVASSPASAAEQHHRSVCDVIASSDTLALFTPTTAGPRAHPISFALLHGGHGRDNPVEKTGENERQLI